MKPLHVFSCVLACLCKKILMGQCKKSSLFHVTGLYITLIVTHICDTFVTSYVTRLTCYT